MYRGSECFFANTTQMKMTGFCIGVVRVGFQCSSVDMIHIQRI